MYSLVYYHRPTRIAEKMLEKAILAAIREDSSFLASISSTDKFLQLEESGLLSRLRESEGFPSEMVDFILSRNCYADVVSLNLEEDYTPDMAFMKSVREDADLVADNLSTLLNDSELQYPIICDIVATRVPGNIRIDKKSDEGEPIELIDASRVVKAMSELDRTLYVSVHPKLVGKSKYEQERLEEQVRKAIQEWSD
jgi:HD superfamily phosphohydrolase